MTEKKQRSGEKELIVFLREDQDPQAVIGRIPLRFARYASTIQKEYGKPATAYLLKVTMEKIE